MNLRAKDSLTIDLSEEMEIVITDPVPINTWNS